MGAWSKVRNFFDRNERFGAPMDDPFIYLDRDALAEELRLRERGAEQGALELPASSMQAFDVIEADIESKIRDHFKRAQIDAANNIRTYDSRLSGLALIANLSSIRTQASIALGEFKTEVINRRSRLTPSRDAIRDSYEELRDFRQENELKRPAHGVPPKSATLGSMAVLWLLETFINSMFLRLGDSMGWLGGIFAAALVGAINVGFAAVIGRQVWPLIHHRDIIRRLFGWFGIISWLVATFAWNLLAGHYRDAKSLAMPNPEASALEMFGTGLESIYSYGLLVAGLLFALGSAMAAYKMDDPYPGYGSVWRRHEKRCDDYVWDVKTATDELLYIRDEAIGEATDVRMELGTQLQQHQQIMSARDTFCRRYGEYAEQLQATANALLQEYRSANRAARSTPPPPKFDQSWQLTYEPLPNAPVLEIQRSAIEAAEQDLEQTILQISTAFDEAIESFEPLDELKRKIADG